MDGWMDTNRKEQIVWIYLIFLLGKCQAQHTETLTFAFWFHLQSGKAHFSLLQIYKKKKKEKGFQSQ